MKIIHNISFYKIQQKENVNYCYLSVDDESITFYNFITDSIMMKHMCYLFLSSIIKWDFSVVVQRFERKGIF